MWTEPYLVRCSVLEHILVHSQGLSLVLTTRLDKFSWIKVIHLFPRKLQQCKFFKKHEKLGITVFVLEGVCALAVLFHNNEKSRDKGPFTDFNASAIWQQYIGTSWRYSQKWSDCFPPNMSSHKRIALRMTKLAMFSYKPTYHICKQRLLLQFVLRYRKTLLAIKKDRGDII